MEEQIKNIIATLSLTVLYLFLIETGSDLVVGMQNQDKFVWEILPLWIFSVHQVISITVKRYEQKKKEEQT